MSDQSEASLGPTGYGQPGPDGGSPNKRAWIAIAVIVAVVIGLVLWLIAANEDDSSVISDSGSTTSEPSTEPSTAPTSEATTSAGGSQSTLPDEAAEGITDVEGAATTPVSVPAPAGAEQSTITGVRAARHEGFDRVVFEFDGPVPGYDVSYADRPIKGDASDKEVRVGGNEVVTVRMTPASAVVLDEDGYHESSNVPDRVAGTGAEVSEVVEVGDFEAQATWAIGLADKVDFAVSTLDSPSRLVVDFVNH